MHNHATHPAIPKIDIHPHILPETWANLRKRYGYGGFVDMEHCKPGCVRRMRLDEKKFEKPFGKSLTMATHYETPTIEQMVALPQRRAWIPSWSTR